VYSDFEPHDHRRSGHDHAEAVGLVVMLTVICLIAWTIWRLARWVWRRVWRPDVWDARVASRSS